MLFGRFDLEEKIMKAAPALVIASLFALLATPAYAGKLYKWTDKDGNVSYQDTPPPTASGRVEEKTLQGATTARAPEGPQRPPVVLYVVPDCAPCDLVRATLQRRKIAFTETNAEGNVAAQTEMKKKTGGLSVPAVTVGDKVVKGHSEAALNAELDAAGYDKMAGAAAPARTATQEDNKEEDARD
jgi:glutaredoxin